MRKSNNILGVFSLFYSVKSGPNTHSLCSSITEVNLSEVPHLKGHSSNLLLHFHEVKANTRDIQKEEKIDESQDTLFNVFTG